MPSERRRRDDYRGARIGAAVALSAAVALMLTADIFSSTYAVEPVVLGLCFSMIGALLAVEVRDLFWPRSGGPS